MKTVNELVVKMTARAKELADMRMDMLRAHYPETTDTQAELILICKERNLSRGDIIMDILMDEFMLEFDRDIEQN